MPSIGFGDKEWPNIEALALDARSAQFHRHEANKLRHLLGAIAANGPLRISAIAVDAHLSYRVDYDLRTRDFILSPPNASGGPAKGSRE